MKIFQRARRLIAALAVVAAVAALSACATSARTGPSSAPTPPISAGAKAPISTGGEADVTLVGTQVIRVSHPELAVLGPQLDGQAVQLQQGASIGLIFLGPPSDAYLVLANPDRHDERPGGYPLAESGTVVFAVALAGTTIRTKDVHLVRHVLQIDGPGLYLYDSVNDPPVALPMGTRLAILAADPRTGMLLQVLGTSPPFGGDRGWLPVTQTGRVFRLLGPAAPR
jgi:hypothetical protein